MSAHPLDIPQDPYSLFGGSAAADGELESTVRAVLRSVGQQPSALASAFFNTANLDDIQSRLRDIVFRRTRYRIDRQSDQQLLIIMRSIFTTYAAFQSDVPGEVRRLNDLVLKEIVPQVGAGLAQFLAYVRDASTLPDPLPRGQATSVKGTKAAELFRI